MWGSSTLYVIKNVTQTLGGEYITRQKKKARLYFIRIREHNFFGGKQNIKVNAYQIIAIQICYSTTD